MKKFNDQYGKIINKFCYKLKSESPVEWAENNRVMTSDVSNFAGKFSYSRNPYMAEIVNHLLPTSPARKIAIMKGAQIGVSTCVLENGIGWIIRNSPANTLLASADSDLVKEQMESKIDNMIENSGLRPFIRPNIQKKRNARTGDTNLSKEFPGGRLYARSVQNAGKWRQTSFKYGFIDDFEAANRTDSREGSVVDLINQRFASFGNSHKIFYISTPALKVTSNIEPLYLEGDQRKYMMPCPLCGEYIPFVFQHRQDREIMGIVWDIDEKNRLIEGSVRYRCQECKGEFYEAENKAKMLSAGKWIPTAEPSEPGFFSYHISALYAAPGMFTWDHYVRMFLKAHYKNDKGKLKTFANVVLGETWEDKGKTVRANKISKNIRPYSIGVVPNELSIRDGNGEIVLITIGADLNGLCMGYNSGYNDGRLDYEVLAHSKSGATYSIDAGSIGTFQNKKDTEGRKLWSYHPGGENNIWEEFNKVIHKEYFSENGRKFNIGAVCVDSGAFAPIVYAFCELNSSLCFAVKGETETQIIRYAQDTISVKQSKDQGNLILVKTNKIKNEISEYMKLEWPEGISQPPGFMNYPISDGEKYTMKGYFKEYEGEEKKLDYTKDGKPTGYRWQKRTLSSRNHFWDCRVYAMAAKDIVLMFASKELKMPYLSWSQFCEIISN